MIEKWALNCIKFPNKKALTSIQDSKSYTYEESTRLIYSASQELLKNKIQKNQLLAIITDFGPDWVILDQAAILAGILVIGIPKNLPIKQRNEILKTIDTDFIIMDFIDTKLSEVYRTIDFNQLKIAYKKTMYTYSIHSIIDEFITTGYSMEEDKTLYLVSSSGTTSKSKASCISLKNVRIYGELITSLMGMGKGDKIFSFLPLSQTRLQDIYLPLYVGAEVIFSSLNRELILDIQSYKPSFIASPPFLFKEVMNKYKDYLCTGQTKLSLKSFMGGASKLYTGTTPVSKSLLSFYKEHGLNLYEAYGSSETCSMVSMNYPGQFNENYQGSILPGVKLKFGLDAEVLVGGINISNGYYNNNKLTSSSFKNGFFHTGDIGEVVDNKLLLHGRKKEIVILDNSNKIFPEMIEKKLNQFPYVNYAMLVGTGYKHLGVLIDVNQTLSEESIQQIVTCLKQYNHVALDKIINYKIYKNKFSIDTGEVTTSFKLKRKHIERIYQNDIKYICESYIKGSIYE